MAFHHLAFATRSLDETHAFYTDVMGMELTCAIHVPPFKPEEYG